MLAAVDRHSIVGSATPAIDSYHIYLPVLNSLKLYSVLTKHCVLDFQGHSSLVTGSAVHPLSRDQVFTCSLDGCINAWDAFNGKLINTVQVGAPLYELIAPQGQQSLFFLLLKPDEGHGKATVGSYCLETEQLHTDHFCLTASGQMRASHKAHCIGLTTEEGVIIFSPAAGFQNSMRLPHSARAQSLAIDEQATRVAAGDASGQVLVWHGLHKAVAELQNGQTPVALPCTRLHWHSHPVRSILFSSDASSVISGGEEGVLVIWDLQTGTRQFIPRLGNCIQGLCHLQEDTGRLLMTQDGGFVRVIDLASMQVECSLSGCGWRHFVSDRSARTIAVATKQKMIAMAIHEQLQFYDLDSLTCNAELQVVQPSHASLNECFCWDISQSSKQTISDACFSPDETHLATVDSANGWPSLKLWQLCGLHSATKAVPYILQTIIERPHKADTTGLRFHPTDAVLVSVGLDGRLCFFKNHLASPLNPWHCSSVHSFPEPLSSVDFSQDGSLLALGSVSKVLLWSCQKERVIGHLTPPPYLSGAVQNLRFIPGTACIAGTLTATAEEAIIVWNALDCTLLWWMPGHITSLATYENSFLAFVIETDSLESFEICKRDSQKHTIIMMVTSNDGLPTQMWLTPHAWRPALLAISENEHYSISPDASPSLLVVSRQGFGHAKTSKQPCKGHSKQENSKDMSVSSKIHNYKKPPKGYGYEAGKPIFERTKPAPTVSQAPTHWAPNLKLLSHDFCEALLSICL